jgi:hypothetical protein
MGFRRWDLGGWNLGGGGIREALEKRDFFEPATEWFFSAYAPYWSWLEFAKGSLSLITPLKWLMLGGRCGLYSSS